VEDTFLANERIERILDQLDLQSNDRVDKITQICHKMGLSKQAVDIALVSQCNPGMRNDTDLR
jgi:DNA-binding phage protein